MLGFSVDTIFLPNQISVLSHSYFAILALTDLLNASFSVLSDSATLKTQLNTCCTKTGWFSLQMVYWTEGTHFPLQKVLFLHLTFVGLKWRSTKELIPNTAFLLLAKDLMNQDGLKIVKSNLWRHIYSWLIIESTQFKTAAAPDPPQQTQYSNV